MNRAEFLRANGECPFTPCQCGGSDRCLQIHADLTAAVDRRVAQEAELLARAAQEAERIRRAEREEVCAWAPAMTWEDKASEFVYSRTFLFAAWTVVIGCLALFLFSNWPY